jgi:hypothetical protein
MILLAALNLAILGMRLWPWQQVFSLPGNGTTGIDPAVSLLGYIGLSLWIAGARREPVKRALSTGAMLGVLAGFLLAGQTMLAARPGFVAALHPNLVQMVLLAASGILWGIAGLLGSRTAGDVSIGMLAGAWSAMVSCLMAATAVFVEMVRAVSPALSQDPWKQYEALAIGPATTQALVNSLYSATAFLLVGPLMGAALGLVFASFRKWKRA